MWKLFGGSPSIDLTPIVKQGSRETVRKDWAEMLLPLFRVVTYVLYSYPGRESFLSRVTLLGGALLFVSAVKFGKYIQQGEGGLSSYAADT